MGIFRLYAELATHLKAQPELLNTQSLDKLAAVYSPYAYIGNRNSLQEAVLRDAKQLRTCRNAPAFGDAESLAAWWFGRRDWRTDSGAFPDFVLASEATSAVGDGALLELKDSRTEAIASFNSTLPSARKSLSRLTAIVADAVRRYEACFRGEGTDERDCFYLVRTHKQDPRACRLSLVQGTFFETLPTPQLLAELWGQLFAQANVPEELQKQVIEYLSQLDRADIAQTRQVERASVKPRLRIMSEIHREGNPHAYHEVPPRSVNLILKLPEAIAACLDASERIDQAEKWVLEQFQRDGALTSGALLTVGTASVQVQLKEIQHRRNGLHLVVQVVV